VNANEIIKIDWREHRSLILNYFVAANLAFLAIDILLAHSINQFAHWAEWIPFCFSVIAPPFLILGREKKRSIVIGVISISIGVIGALLHLESQFFKDFTLKSLVYTAPFVAPLAYGGLGLLVIANELFEASETRWSYAVLFAACGGYFGNFILALCDHAQNGFFHWSEWIPVVAGALGTGFLGAPMLLDATWRYTRAALFVMGIGVIVGSLGFVLHLRADIMAREFVFRAPLFAPLLFPNLSLLGAFALFDLQSKKA